MTGKTGVIYLQKDKFQMYSPFLASIVEFRFMPEVIRDLDVVNVELLGNLIRVFITNGKISPSNLVIVLADNAYFVKDFVYPAPVAQKGTVAPQKITHEDLQKQADVFVEHVPYDNVVSITIPLKNGIRVCAVNQDLFKSLKLAFDALGFPIDAVLPGVVFGDNLSAQPVMSAAMANIIVTRVNALKQYNLLSQTTYQPASQRKSENVENVTIEAEEELPEQNKKPDKKRLFILIGVFVLLIIVLIIVAVQNLTPTKPQPLPAQAVPAAPVVKEASTINTNAPPAAVATSIPTAQPQNIAIQIMNASGSETLGQSLRTQLTKYAFKSVTVQSQPSVSSSTTVISFSPVVGQNVRTAVLDEVKKVKSEVTVQETQSSASDITIILSK